MWSRAAVLPADMAAMQPRDNIARASVEGKNIETREVVTLAECDGWDWCLFQWMEELRCRMGDVSAAVKTIVGMQLVTRDTWIEVKDNGEVNRTPRTAEDMSYHYESFGR